MASAWADYDGDGCVDLFVSNLLPGNSSRLYRNQGDGTFKEVTQAVGLPPLVLSSGATWGDIDNDGDPDLYGANDSMANFLFRNRGDGRFLDVAALGGVAYNQDGRE